MATKRLIDANAFWESVSTDYWEHFTQCHTTDQIDLMEMVEENLAEQPTVDAVEVVRCKDCIYYEIGKDYEPYCNHVTHGIPYPKADAFCSYGEKRYEK